MSLSVRIFVACCGWMPLAVMVLYAERVPVPGDSVTLVLGGVYALLGASTAWIVFEEFLRGCLPPRRRRTVPSAD